MSEVRGLPKQKFAHSAFTLAEVLITLAIIGVVAALTIPTVVRNYQERQMKTAAKKALSTLVNATNLVIMDNGGTMITSDNTANFEDISKRYKDMYKKHIAYIKECDSIGECTSSGVWHNNADWKTYDGKPVSSLKGGIYSCAGLKGKDGILWRFYFYSPTCSHLGRGECGQIHVDVNGFKKPNQLGKDIFEFYVRYNRVTNVAESIFED